MATLRRSLHEKKKELSTITEEIAKCKSTIAFEEKALDERLAEARESLLGLKAEETRRVRDEREVQGQEFLKKVVNRTVTYIEQCDDIEKRTSASLVDQIKRRI